MTKQVSESGLDLHTSMREAPRSAEAEAFSSGERLCFDSVDYGVMIVDDCLDIQVWNRWMVSTTAARSNSGMPGKTCCMGRVTA